MLCDRWFFRSLSAASGFLLYSPWLLVVTDSAQSFTVFYHWRRYQSWQYRLCLTANFQFISWNSNSSFMEFSLLFTEFFIWRNCFHTFSTVTLYCRYCGVSVICDILCIFPEYWLTFTFSSPYPLSLTIPLKPSMHLFQKFTQDRLPIWLILVRFPLDLSFPSHNYFGRWNEYVFADILLSSSTLLGYWKANMSNLSVLRHREFLCWRLLHFPWIAFFSQECVRTDMVSWLASFVFPVNKPATFAAIFIIGLLLRRW